MKKQGFNPYLPSWEYIPDGEPYVFGNRVYVYGSHDRFNGYSYCLNEIPITSYIPQLWGMNFVMPPVNIPLRILCTGVLLSVTTILILIPINRLFRPCSMEAIIMEVLRRLQENGTSFITGIPMAPISAVRAA